jgi:proton-translocating NADH-quinone oxidoreductase chain L
MNGTPLDILPTLLGLAVLLPLASFGVIVFFGPRLGKHGYLACYVATGAILTACVLSFVALGIWLAHEGVQPVAHDAGHDAPHAGHDAPHAADQVPTTLAGNWYAISPPGLTNALTIGYYIDALTVVMFVMVTFIATCIHFYSIGYMHEELHDVTDHEVTLADGKHLHRRGRFHRFFQYMSLFCFSMLGLVISGNVLMTFVFWELVGICSYFLIGFYIERRSASNAANKAFIVNRVGDFGFIVGLMALWGSLGTFQFGDVRTPVVDAAGAVVRDDAGQVVYRTVPGIFSLVRPADQHYQLTVPEGMALAAAGPIVAREVADHLATGMAFLEGARAQALYEIQQHNAEHPDNPLGYGLLVLAGLGIFCGCVGKSAQFPLHTWLPDAMEGPTPVSALVHSATMVAAGVYLVGRFFPVFAPEVLLVIAVVGCITLLLAATIAITANDIKRVLAYSTVSQLGYMMLALGIGGWLAGLFHLITHAFFKSLLFLCSGSVIHACHTNDMQRMGGLRHKMPWTAYTMLIGCLAIAGAPFFSGFYSKDYIIAQAMSFADANPGWVGLLVAAAGGAAITAFYMFRLWYLTFAGQPRDAHVYAHVHESPRIMYVPLVVLAVLAVSVAWTVPTWLPGIGGLSIEALLEQARPAGTALGAGHGTWWNVTYPSEAASHAFGGQALLVASGTALAGFLLATLMYGLRKISADEAARQFQPIYRLLWNKWYFDELYDRLFVQPVHWVSQLVARADRRAIDGLLDGSARSVQRVSFNWDSIIDRAFVDGLVNLIGHWVYAFADGLRALQTGKVRQYVLFIVVGTVALFVLISFWNRAVAGS